VFDDRCELAARVGVVVEVVLDLVLEVFASVGEVVEFFEAEIVVECVVFAQECVDIVQVCARSGGGCVVVFN